MSDRDTSTTDPAPVGTPGEPSTTEPAPAGTSEEASTADPAPPSTPLRDGPTPPPPEGSASPRPGERLEFGPSGYLPERASKRARKIVLRAPLGLQWVVASAVAGVVLLVAGLVFLLQSSDGPRAPWVEVGELAALDAAYVDDDLDALIVAAGGRVRAFADAVDVTYCAASNRLEAPDGRVWALTGRGFGTGSLSEHPTFVHDGALYVDPTRTSAGPDPTTDPADPACS